MRQARYRRDKMIFFGLCHAIQPEICITARLPGLYIQKSEVHIYGGNNEEVYSVAGPGDNIITLCDI